MKDLTLGSADSTDRGFLTQQTAYDDGVVVVGAGSMATTLAHVVASGGRPCTLLCESPTLARQINRHGRAPRFPGPRLADAVSATTSFEVAIASARLVVVAVPSVQFRPVARQLKRYVRHGHWLVSATKALERKTFKRMSEILAEETGVSSVGAIAGPNITSDMAAGRLTSLVVASRSLAVRARTAKVLEGSKIRIHQSQDVLSVELIAALKNAAAIAVSAAAGFSLGFNARSLALICALRELRVLLPALGANASVLFDLAGLGDIFLSTSSPDSLNCLLGNRLGRGWRLSRILAQMPEVPEGIQSLRACRALASRHGVELPLLNMVGNLLRKPATPAIFERALARSDALPPRPLSPR